MPQPTAPAALAKALWSIAFILALACALIWMDESSSSATTQTLTALSRHAIAFGRANTGTPGDADRNPRTSGYQGLPTSRGAPTGGPPAFIHQGKILCIYYGGEHVVLADPKHDQVVLSDGPCPFGRLPAPAPVR